MGVVRDKNRICEVYRFTASCCRVFHAEQMFSRTQTYHKKCFNCASCKVSKPTDRYLSVFISIRASLASELLNVYI